MIRKDLIPHEWRKKFKGKPMMTSADIVSLGIVKDRSSLLEWRRKGIGPPFIMMCRRILYPTDQFFDWVEKHCFLTKKNYTIPYSTVRDPPEPKSKGFFSRLVKACIPKFLWKKKIDKGDPKKDDGNR